jgi:hypothetical protein
MGSAAREGKMVSRRWRWREAAAPGGASDDERGSGEQDAAARQPAIRSRLMRRGSVGVYNEGEGENNQPRLARKKPRTSLKAS